MSSKEAETRKQSKCMFIAFVALSSLIIISGSFHLLLWILVTIQNNFLSPIQLCSLTHLLCVVTWKHITFLYVIGPIVHFIQWIFKSAKRRKKKKYTFMLSFIVK